MKIGTLCYVRQDGKTLMLHRIKKPNDMHQGKWNGLGGKMAPGETPEECVVREVREESGLAIRKPRLHGVLTFPGFEKEEEDWYVFVFSATDFTGDLIDCNEGVLEWIDDRHLLDLDVWDGDRIFIPWINQDHFFSAKFTYKKGELVSYDVRFHGAQPGLQITAEECDEEILGTQ